MAAVVLFSLLILGLARGARVRLAWVAGRARGKRCSNAGNRKRKRGRSRQKPPSRRWLENLRLIVDQLGESGRLGVGHLASCFFSSSTSAICVRNVAEILVSGSRTGMWLARFYDVFGGGNQMQMTKP